ncbi:MAG TPA: L,D-transpeptidase [Thermoanaerobaculia bacterium]|nr:L,D-transpeptidase [Thermoanaerobaculia bacterium]
MSVLQRVIASIFISTIPFAALGGDDSFPPDPTHERVQPTIDCDRPEGLPPEAPCIGTIVTVDTAKNLIYLYRDGSLVARAPAATGMNRLLITPRNQWLFRTPQGRMRILRKVVDPVWVKPDWAFVEERRPVPPGNSPTRRERGVLGKYALDLGDGIMIHGTREIDSLGRNASHGCIRVGREMLEKIYRAVDVGTAVYVFASEPLTYTVEDRRTGRTFELESVSELFAYLNR